MRAMDYLVQLYPEKTGAELLEIQKQDKLEDENNYKKANEKKLAIIEDINANGGFYRGTFGLNQYYFYSFTNLKLDSGVIYTNVERITVFDNFTKPFSCEIESDRFGNLEDYGLNFCERVTKEDYEKVRNFYTGSIDLFWERIKN